MSLFDILEKLEVNVAPKEGKVLQEIKKINLPVQYRLVSLWLNETRKKQKITIAIELIDPDGNKLIEFGQELRFPSGKLRMRNVVRIKGINLTTSGIYYFVIRYKEDDRKKLNKVAEIPLEVVIKSQTTVSTQ